MADTRACKVSRNDGIFFMAIVVSGLSQSPTAVCRCRDNDESTMLRLCIQTELLAHIAAPALRLVSITTQRNAPRTFFRLTKKNVAKKVGNARACGSEILAELQVRKCRRNCGALRCVTLRRVITYTESLSDNDGNHTLRVLLHMYFCPLRCPYNLGN